MHKTSGLTAPEKSAVRSLAHASNLTETQIIRVGLSVLLGNLFDRDGSISPAMLPVLDAAGATLARQDRLREFAPHRVADLVELVGAAIKDRGAEGGAA